VNQLQRQAWFAPYGGLLRPSAKQVPRTQAEMFRNQQPQADHRVADLIGQSLPDATFDAERIAIGVPDHFTGDLCGDLFGRHARTTFVKFFFEARIP
jgi:hypothetical protein